MAEIWQLVASWLESTLGLPPIVVARVFQTLALVIIYLVLRKLINRAVERRVEEPHRRFVYRQTTSYVLGMLAALSLVVIWVGGLSGLAAYLGLVSAGCAIALQDPLVNLAGWAFIAIRKPFVVGDRIQVGDHAGDVVERRLFQFTIVEIGNWVDADQSTGRLIHIPNGWVFKQSTINYTQGFNYLWNELPIMVTFESNWEKAKELLSEISTRHSVNTPEAEKEIKQAAAKHNLYFAHLDPIVWTSVADSGVTLTIRYLCNPRRRRSTETEIWEDVLREFARNDDIDFAYPSVRYYDNVSEGKPGARAEPEK